MIMPEVNSDHVRLIERQKKRLCTEARLYRCQNRIAPFKAMFALTPPLDWSARNSSRNVPGYFPVQASRLPTGRKWSRTSYRISVAKKRRASITSADWGTFDGESKLFDSLKISAQCLRVAVQEGHTAAVWVKFKETRSR